jgi:hypothetical protein
MQDAVLVWGGNDATDFSATHHFLHNTIVGDFFGSVFNFERVKAHNPDAVLENNLFAGTAARNVDYGHTDATLVSDYNVWVSAAAYRHKGAAATTLAGWRALGFDGNGRNCSAAFVDAPADLHLAPEDDCALDVGTDVSPLVTTDVDGDPRPQHGSPDIGADELAGDTGILLDDFETGDIRRWTPPGP